jgi:hypothetical protein
MKNYSVKTRFVFTGTFFVAAETEAEAKERVKNDCGLVLGGNIHSTLGDNEVDWKFPMHPDTKILDIRRNKQYGRI